jgi:hypothetical protein
LDFNKCHLADKSFAAVFNHNNSLSVDYPFSRHTENGSASEGREIFSAGLAALTAVTVAACRDLVDGSLSFIEEPALGDKS